MTFSYFFDKFFPIDTELYTASYDALYNSPIAIGGSRYGLFPQCIGFGAGNRRFAIFCISSKDKGMGAFSARDVSACTPHHGVCFHNSGATPCLSGTEGVLNDKYISE